MKKKTNLFVEYYKLRIILFIIIFILIPFPVNNYWIPYGIILITGIVNLLNQNPVNIYNLAINGLIDIVISMVLSLIISLIILRVRKRI